MVSCLALLQGDKGAPGRVGLHGEIGPIGDFGECCWDGENRASPIQGIPGSVGTSGLWVLLDILKQIILIRKVVS